MKRSIFYSWQSDSPGKTNKQLIQEALQFAIAEIVASDEWEVEPVLDRDTRHVPGAPAIADTILAKIDQCGIFLCDLTLIAEKSADRASPNPNVLIELGYAVARIGWERMIFVMNTHYGEQSQLPFDLLHRRWPIPYSLPPDASQADIRAAQKKMTKTLRSAILLILQSIAKDNLTHPKDRRVAEQFHKALLPFTMSLLEFLNGGSYQDGMQFIYAEYDDASNNGYPPQDLVEPIITVLSRNSLLAASNFRLMDGRVQSWAEAFLIHLNSASASCTQIQNQSADRDEALIYLVNEVHEVSNLLAIQLSHIIGNSIMKKLYEQGSLTGITDTFRQLLIIMIKSYQVMRQFDVDFA